MSKKRRIPKDPTVEDIVSIVGNARFSVLQRAARELGWKLDFGLANEPSYLGDAIAYRIRAELVCCDLYNRVNVRRELTLAQAMESHGSHDRCYWGEASAQIAEGRCPGYDTTPNICRCSCEGCKRNCNAHVEAAGEKPEPMVCRCGHTEEQHLSKEEYPEPQCKVCPEDGEKMWIHPFTPQTEEERCG